MLKPIISIIAVAALAGGIAACGGSSSSGTGTASGAVAVDGSSTVFPFAQAAAEGFQAENPDAKVTVGESGTGGGFEKFCAGEIDIADASRPIDDADEVPVCKKNKVEYAQIEVANDGIAIVTHNMQQAARVSDRTAFFIVDMSSSEEARIGRLVEYGPTDRIFTNPHDIRTEEYVSGKFG